jgi:hypothetical protein
MAQPVLATNGTPSSLFNINVDFDDTPPTASLTYAPAGFGAWDVSNWDSGTWGTDLQVSKAWQGVTGVGKCASGRLKVVSAGIQVQWMSTNYVMQAGGIL